MNPKPLSKTIVLNDGREIIIETGKLAKQAHGSVVIKMGNCMLLSTVVSNYGESTLDFLPLTVDYREKFASAGRFPGGFFKREARPSNEEILTMRIVDRVLRPLFPKDYYNETQVMIQLMSHDENVMPDALVGLAASAALSLSDIPFDGPISEVRVARIDGNFLINPSKAQLEESDIDMMVGASEDSVVMVEGEFNEISEEEMTEAIRYAHEEIKAQIKAQKELIELVGVSSEKREYDSAEEDTELENQIIEKTYQKCYDIAKKGLSKNERSELFSNVKQELVESFDEETYEEKKDLILNYFNKSQKKAVRDLVLNEGIRLDGRKPDNIRNIWTEIDYLPSTHGSAVFTRGETQALASVTLGTSREANVIDMPTDQSEETFYLHYNFPPFSTGEARPLRGTSRREVGHGNLAQRALKKVMPSDCPYTVRIVSEILESNGSSSMASVCAGSLALMDAGINIKSNVSGIAMGLITEGEKYAVLSDILGDEDHLGDMDFKVAGTQEGITALQMDIKIDGITEEIFDVALEKAQKARAHILDSMNEVLPASRKELSDKAPQAVVIQINTKKIRDVIGKGGETIRGLTEETGAIIEVEDSGKVTIYGDTPESRESALQRIEEITAEPEVNKVYTGTVANIMDFGAFVTIMPGRDGLVHVSEISEERVENVSDYFVEGEEVKVKVLEVDRQGKIRLTMKGLED